MMWLHIKWAKLWPAGVLFSVCVTGFISLGNLRLLVPSTADGSLMSILFSHRSQRDAVKGISFPSGPAISEGPRITTWWTLSVCSGAQPYDLRLLPGTIVGGASAGKLHPDRWL